MATLFTPKLNDPTKVENRSHFLRYAGNLEKASISRHSLGLLGPIAVTARYVAPHSHATNEPNLEEIFYPALQEVLAQHPALNCVILNEKGSNPAFLRLKTIDLRNHFFFFSTSKTTRRSEKELEKLLVENHSLSFPDVSAYPPWKLLVLIHAPSTGSSTTCCYDVSFVFHHALIDGLSGMAFHHSLLKAWNNPKTDKSLSFLVTVPEDIQLPPPVEDQLNLKITSRCLFSLFCKEIQPEWTQKLFPPSNLPWTGRITPNAGAVRLSTGLRVIEFDEHRFQKIRDKCKELGVTFTTMLHGIIVVCLARHIPKAKAFISTTPYSVRSFKGTNPFEIVNQYSVVTTLYGPEIIESIHKPEAILGPEMTQIGSQYSRELENSKKVFPVDNMLSLLKLVPNFNTFFQNQLGKPRGASFEVSNIGAISPFPGGGSHNNQEWKINRLLFTQAGSVLGNVLSFNVASVEGGSLTISLTWQKDAVDANIAENVFRSVQDALNALFSS